MPVPKVKTRGNIATLTGSVFVLIQSAKLQEDQKWVWFVQEMLNEANIVFPNLIVIDNAITVPSKHHIDLMLAYNQLLDTFQRPHTILKIK